MQMKLIGIRVPVVGHRIKSVASASAAIIVVIGAGENKKGIMRAIMRRLQLIRIMGVGTVLTKYDPKFIGYASIHGYGHGYGYLRGPYTYGYSGASDDPKRLAKPTLN
jgi:hypothetical protein